MSGRRSKRNGARGIVAMGAGLLVVGALFAGAAALEGGGTPAAPTSEEAARVAALKAQGFDMTPGVVDNRGNKVGTMDERELVQLPAGVQANPVRDVNGALVGYMTRGDLGFVDVETGKSAEKLGRLGDCYAAMIAFAQAGGAPLEQGCRTILSDYGFPLLEQRDDPEIRRCLNMRGQNRGEVDATCKAVLDALPVK